MLHIFEAYEEEFPSNRKEVEAPAQSPLSSMNSVGSTDLLSSEKWFKSEIALPPRVDTSNSFDCCEEGEEGGPGLIQVEKHKQTEITTPTDAETPAKYDDQLLIAAKKYMSTTSTECTGVTLSSAVNTLEKVNPFMINDSLKKPANLILTHYSSSQPK